MRHLPVWSESGCGASEGPLDELDQVVIASPCTVPWESMKGQGAVRFCGQCAQNVYDVSQMARAEALQLMRTAEPACLRIYRRADGRVTTADCWSRLRAARQRGLWPFVGMMFVIACAFAGAAWVGLLGLETLTSRSRTMGAVAPVRPQPEPEEEVRLMGQAGTFPVDPAPEVPAPDGELKGRRLVRPSLPSR